MAKTTKKKSVAKKKTTAKKKSVNKIADAEPKTTMTDEELNFHKSQIAQMEAEVRLSHDEARLGMLSKELIKQDQRWLKITSLVSTFCCVSSVGLIVLVAIVALKLL